MIGRSNNRVVEIILCRCSEFGEGEGEQGADGGEDEDFIGADEDYLDVGTGKFLVFKQSLAARPAGCYRLGYLAPVGSAGGDGDFAERHVGVCCSGIEASRTLGACS